MDSHRPPLRHAQIRSHTRRLARASSSKISGQEKRPPRVDHLRRIPRRSPTHAPRKRRSPHRHRNHPRRRSLLTDRSGLPRRRKLLRVILDSRLRLSPESRIVQTADDDLLVFTLATLKSPKARQLQNAGVELVRAKSLRGRIDLRSVLQELGRRDILSVLLEAGPSLNASALAASVIDKFALFFAPKFAGSSAVISAASANRSFAARRSVPLFKVLPAGLPALRVLSVRQIGPDVLFEAAFPR